MSQSSAPICVAVVHPYPIIQCGIQFLLAGRPGIQYVGGTTRIADFNALVQKTNPSVVFLRLAIPAEQGFAQIQNVRRQYPNLGIIVLAAMEDAAYAERCFHLGVNAFLSKTVSPEDLLMAIERAAAGDVFCSDEMKSILLQRAAQPSALAGREAMARLSASESRVLGMIGNGMTTHQIARALTISTKTVATYKARLKQKLGLKRGVELMHLAVSFRTGNDTSA